MISWWILKRKCLNCGVKISYKYFLTELTCAVLFAITTFAQPTNHLANSPLILIVMSCLFFSILLPLTLLDIQHLWLPESICRIGAAIGFFVVLITLTNTYPPNWMIFEHSLSAIFGFIFFRSLSKFSKFVLGKEALGRGDAKLIALVAIWLGFVGLCLSTYLAFVFAGFYAILGLIFKRVEFGEYIPFGPFISLSASLVWLFGNEFWLSRIFFLSNYIY